MRYQQWKTLRTHLTMQGVVGLLFRPPGAEAIEACIAGFKWAL